MSHYFDARPGRESRQRTIRVSLRGTQVEVLTDRNVFSADRLDLGTAVLLRTVADPPSTGTLVDLGCGWGPIALAMALAAPKARVLALDVNERALHLTAANAKRLGLGNVETWNPQDLLAAEPDLAISELWSNPPIRVGKSVLHELLGAWLPRLEEGASARLVVQKNLGADSLHRWLETELGMPTRRSASSKGFRVLTVQNVAPPADEVPAP
ncbi:MAG TPA: methyltransferase [Beutenbergiaceae bacterium]|nr:methyltransferase [Beutenbergiaceae bacterium]